ncbi:MAG: glycosyltransferase family 4 protein [Tissierella sp.]|uniref:glycosyltransferase family 4 protein n=1 Tax=Tissierella sp. TaxID=41274 RepID=UPI003F999133
MKNIDSKKNIWIFHHYATPPSMNGFTRPFDFGIKLKDYNYSTTIFAASYLHFAEQNLIEDETLYIEEDSSGLPFVFINTPGYAGSGKKRILNMLTYFRKLFKVSKEYEKTHEKPDLIIASSPHPLTMIAGIKIAKRYGIPCICEVRDFWPEVFFMGDKLKKDSIIGKILLKGEHWIYKNADGIIFLKEGDVQYLTDEGWSKPSGGDVDLSKCYYINNGVDIEKFNDQMDSEVLEDKDLKSDKFKIVYAGAIRPVNNVDNILDTANLLKEYKDIEFLIYGQGNMLEHLKRRLENENISNVKLKGYVDKRYIPYILSNSSINLLNYSQTQYNWSRGNSSNKLFEYMASGKPIISTVKMGYSPIEKYNCGLSLEGSSAKSLKDTILKIYNMPKDEYIQMGENGKKGAREFDYIELTKKLKNVIEKHINNNS